MEAQAPAHPRRSLHLTISTPLCSLTFRGLACYMPLGAQVEVLRSGLWKKQALILRIFVLRERMTGLPFQRAAKCNVAFHSAGE